MMHPSSLASLNAFTVSVCVRASLVSGLIFKVESLDFFVFCFRHVSVFANVIQRLRPLFNN